MTTVRGGAGGQINPLLERPVDELQFYSHPCWLHERQREVAAWSRVMKLKRSTDADGQELLLDKHR